MCYEYLRTVAVEPCIPRPYWIGVARHARKIQRKSLFQNLHFLFGSVCLSLAPPVRDKKFQTEIQQSQMNTSTRRDIHGQALRNMHFCPNAPAHKRGQALARDKRGQKDPNGKDVSPHALCSEQKTPTVESIPVQVKPLLLHRGCTT